MDIDWIDREGASSLQSEKIISNAVVFCLPSVFSFPFFTFSSSRAKNISSIIDAENKSTHPHTSLFLHAILSFFIRLNRSDAPSALEHQSMSKRKIAGYILIELHRIALQEDVFSPENSVDRVEQGWQQNSLLREGKVMHFTLTMYPHPIEMMDDVNGGEG